MVTYRCVVTLVLGCSSSNKSGVGLHRIPWNKQELRRQCIENIVVMGKTQAHVIICESRVCDLHSTEHSSKKPYEIPTVFPGIQQGYYCL